MTEMFVSDSLICVAAYSLEGFLWRSHLVSVSLWRGLYQHFDTIVETIQVKAQSQSTHSSVVRGWYCRCEDQY